MKKKRLLQAITYDDYSRKLRTKVAKEKLLKINNLKHHSLSESVGIHHSFQTEVAITFSSYYKHGRRVVTFSKTLNLLNNFDFLRYSRGSSYLWTLELSMLPYKVRPKIDLRFCHRLDNMKFLKIFFFA